MLLGLSSTVTKSDIDIAAVAADDLDGGISHGAILTRFAEAVHTGDGLVEARDAVSAALGPAGLVDAAAICANFNMMVRIADGTGTPLDAGSVEISADLRSDLALDDLTSRRV